MILLKKNLNVDLSASQRESEEWGGEKVKIGEGVGVPELRPGSDTKQRCAALRGSFG